MDNDGPTSMEIEASHLSDDAYGWVNDIDPDDYDERVVACACRQFDNVRELLELFGKRWGKPHDELVEVISTVVATQMVGLFDVMEQRKHKEIAEVYDEAIERASNQKSLRKILSTPCTCKRSKA